jgi:hypothetical protein
MEFHKKLDTGGKEMTKQYYHRFMVKGDGYFPYDMLRYDACWPSTSDDVINLGLGEKRKVTLTTIGNKDRKPTFARWESFGWKVIESGTYRTEV